uniref:Uncharacterized protein n=1 Tax=Plectus sambesii TaxID=2011161 RepID=A0A914WB83_9BILA
MRNLVGIIAVIVITINAANAVDYFGVKLGTLRNTTFGLTGDVWLVNGTAVQITNLNLNPAREKLDLSFYFSTAEEVAKGEQIYQILNSPNGQYAKPIGVSLDGGFQNARLVVTIPNNYKKWAFFGVVAEDKW